MNPPDKKTTTHHLRLAAQSDSGQLRISKDDLVRALARHEDPAMALDAILSVLLDLPF